jgi:hypothetical protein
MSKIIGEVREEDASDEVRAIYADIKQATGIPYVNLIFRHLAVHPEMLDWAWDAIGPIYREGRIAAAVKQLQIAAPQCGRPEFTPDWSGLSATDLQQVKAILAFYNRGNPSNLIGLSTLVAAARGENNPASPPRIGGGEVNNPADIAVPPLPRPEQLDPDAVALARDLGKLQIGGERGIVPSLYLHIALCPAAMVAAHRVVRPLLTAETWPQQLADTIASARELAAELAASIDVSKPRPPADIFDAYIDMANLFTEATIPEMVIVGKVLGGGS